MRHESILAVVAASLVTHTLAQSTSQPLAAGPTNAYQAVWSIPTATTGNAVCANGGTPIGTQGGVYQDGYGTYWEVLCNMDWSGQAWYDGSTTTNGWTATGSQGIWSCFRSCSSKPGCVAFTHIGTVTTSFHTGTGRCYLQFTGRQGNLVTPNANVGTGADSAAPGSTRPVFAAAYMIQSSPTMICPYYDRQTYTTSGGTPNTYNIVCNYYTTGAGLTNLGAVSNVWTFASCMQSCDSTAGCVAAAYYYSSGPAAANAETTYNTANTQGRCQLKQGTATSLSAQPQYSNYAFAYRPASGPAMPPPYSPPPSLCPAANGTTLTSAGGVSYRVSCSSSVGNPLDKSVTGLTSIEECEVAAETASGGGTAGQQTALTFNAANGVCFYGSAKSNFFTYSTTGTSVTALIRTDSYATMGCYQHNGDGYIGPAGNAYLIECGLERDGAQIGGQFTTNSFDACMDLCETTSGCAAVSFTGTAGGTACYLKSSAGTTVTQNAQWYARRTTLPPSTCPGVDQTTVTENGFQYKVACGSSVSPLGGSYGNGAATNSWYDCLGLCDGSTGCTGVTYFGVSGSTNGNAPGTCYFRNDAIIGFQQNTTQRVAAVRIANFQQIVTTTTTSIISSTTSIGSSFSISSSTLTVPTPTGTPITFACPSSDQQTVVENGNSYVVGCASIIVPAGSFANQPVVNSWNDCFGLCDVFTGCTGFVYNGVANGAGAGTCYFRNNAVIGFAQNVTTRVAAIRATNFQQIVTTTMTTSTTSTTTSTTSTITTSTSSSSTDSSSFSFDSSSSSSSTRTRTGTRSSTTTTILRTDLSSSSSTSPYSSSTSDSLSSSSIDSASSSLTDTTSSITTSSSSLSATSSLSTSSSSTDSASSTLADTTSSITTPSLSTPSSSTDRASSATSTDSSSSSSSATSSPSTPSSPPSSSSTTLNTSTSRRYATVTQTIITSYVTTVTQPGTTITTTAVSSYITTVISVQSSIMTSVQSIYITATNTISGSIATVTFTAGSQTVTATPSAGLASTIVATYTSIIPGPTQTITQASVGPGGQTVYATIVSTAPAATQTIVATTTATAPTVVFVGGAPSGFVRTVSGQPQTVTVAYCPCYPGMMFKRQNDDGVVEYSHCTC